MFARSLIQLGLLLRWTSLTRCEPPFKNPAGVDVWCGKAYRETNSSFDPGGWLEAPEINSPPYPLRLSLHVYPRYTFYLTSEKSGTLIVDTRVSDVGNFGGIFKNSTFDPEKEPNGTEPIAFTELVLKVYNEQRTLFDDVRIPVNESGIQVSFDLQGVQDGDMYIAMGSSPDFIQTFQTTTTIQVLPARNDTGSMSRIDRLSGGLHVRSHITNDAWKSIFPVSFYTRWDWISWVIDPENHPMPPNLASNNTQDLTEFRQRGYNIIHPVPPGGWNPFDTDLFDRFLAICDDLELYVMYDMRHTYLNLSSISYQLPRLQKHPSLLLYYTADEPDGWTDPLNGTELAYRHMQSLDPYHPVSLVLNCYNFYFEEYTSGADIIMEDTYNLIKSSSFSTVYNTPCNRTYGDCGCDFCHTGDEAYPEYVAEPFLDVEERVDRLYEYQRWTDSSFTKPVWGVPQWFYDANSFWSRWATGEEAIVMALLRVNHGAMGLVGWLFPTSEEVEKATTDLAIVLTREDVTNLLIDAPRQLLQSEVTPALDTAVWIGEEEMLIIIVYPVVEAGQGQIIKLPRNITGVDTLLGSEWGFKKDGLEIEGLFPLAVSVLKARLA